ncbi:MAG: hypothetical protein ABSE47_04690 [Acidimicrobiales bacterium]|jgi:hypothetical protein
MFDVTLDAEVLGRLAASLERWGFELTNVEWSHLVGLVGLGSSAVAEAVGGRAAELDVAAPGVVPMTTPGFADALSAAADAVMSRAVLGQSVVIATGPDAGLWVAKTRPRSA